MGKAEWSKDIVNLQPLFGNYVSITDEASF